MVIGGPPFLINDLPTGVVDPADRYRKAGPRSTRRAAAPAPVSADELRDATARMIREVPIARLVLAVTDPTGEWDAVVRVDRDAAIRALRRRLAPPAHPSAPARKRPRRDGRDLLLRIGADPSRGRGVVRCPAHDDRRPSLSWRLADDGGAALHCFAGCTFRAIVEAVS